MGFPSPATDYAESPLSIDELCQLRAPSVYIIRFLTGSIAEQIRPGSMLVIDSSRKPENGALVVIEKTGEFVVKRYNATAGGIRLENLDEPERGQIVSPCELDDYETTICFGVVTHILASLS